MTEQTISKLERNATNAAKLSFLLGATGGLATSYFTSNYFTPIEIKPILYGTSIGAGIAAVSLGIGVVSYISRTRNFRGRR